MVAIRDARSVRSSEEDEDASAGRKLSLLVLIAKPWLDPQVTAVVILLINTVIKLFLEL